MSQGKVLEDACDPWGSCQPSDPKLIFNERQPHTLLYITYFSIMDDDEDLQCAATFFRDVQVLLSSFLTFL